MGKTYNLFYDKAYAYCRKVCSERGLDFDLCPNESAVLFLLLSEPGTDTACTIAQKLHMAPALVSRVLDGLTRKGYTETRRDTQDRRVYRITLSPSRGNDLERIRTLCREFTAKLVAGIDRADLDSFFHVLNQMEFNAGSIL